MRLLFHIKYGFQKGSHKIKKKYKILLIRKDIKKLKYVKTIKKYKILTQVHLNYNLSSNVGERRFTWLAHGRELREMWCCPLPKGLGTSHGPHGLVYTGQPHRDWLGIKQ